MVQWFDVLMTVQDNLTPLNDYLKYLLGLLPVQSIDKSSYKFF